MLKKSITFDGDRVFYKKPVHHVVYFKTDAEFPTIHYTLNGIDWTESPGVLMHKSEVDGYFKFELVSAGEHIRVSFCDEHGNWMSNLDAGYEVHSNVVTIENGHVYHNAPVHFELHYKTSSDCPTIHFTINGEHWTDEPGLPMHASDVPGYFKYDIISASDRIQICFTDGYGNWDPSVHIFELK